MDTSSNPTTADAASQSSDISDAQFDSITAAAVASADTSSATNIESLGLIHQARTARLAREVINLTALHGATSAQVIAAKAAQSDAQSIATRVELVRRQAVATAPAVTANGWAVWGHVYQSPATPLSGYTVFLVDNQKSYQSQYGFATTAADGSFAIVYAGGTENAAASSTPPGAASSGGETNSAAAIPTLFVSVTNANGQLVPTGITAALAIAFGQALYVDITVAADAQAVDLPKSVRKTAQPPTQKDA